MLLWISIIYNNKVINQRNKKTNRDYPPLLWIEVRNKKWIQMVLNKLIKERFDHETVLLTLSDLLACKWWDDTNFITFETLILQIARTIHSNDTRISYALLWRKYQEKKSKDKINTVVTWFWEDIKSLLEWKPKFASWNGWFYAGTGAYSIWK